MEAEHFTNKTDGARQSRWERIEDYGHTLSGMRTYANAYDSVNSRNKCSHALNTGCIYSHRVTSKSTRFLHLL